MSHGNVIRLIRFLGERSGEGVVLFEEGGDVASVNATARRLLKLWRREDAALLPTVCERLGLRQSEIFNLEGAGVPWCATLFERLVEVHLFGFPVQKGFPRYTMALLRDVEKEKETEQARNEFLLLVSQELRNPIEALRGVVRTLKEGLLGEVSEQQKEFLEVIELQMDGVAEFVSNLLEFSSVLVGGYRFRRSPLGIREVLSRVKLKIDNIARARRVRVSLQVEPGIPRFYGDEERILQAVTAISAAAVRLRSKGGIVEIGACMERQQRTTSALPRGTLLVSVRMGNVGLSKLAADNVLQRPAATEMTAAKECGAFGLALLVCKSVALGHGGKIWTEGQGGLLHSVTMLLPMELRGRGDRRTEELADGEPDE